MDLVPARGYLLGSGRTLLHANPPGFGEAKALDDGRLRELEALTRPLAAPPGVFVFRIEDPAFRGHLVIDPTGPVDLDAVARAFARTHHFTRAQTEVFVRWMRGMSESEIARDLGRSNETVRTHLAKIRQGTGISNKLELLNLVRNLAGR